MVKREANIRGHILSPPVRPLPFRLLGMLRADDGGKSDHPPIRLGQPLGNYHNFQNGSFFVPISFPGNDLNWPVLKPRLGGG